ncbi:thioredoxin domain-containing protein [Salegentibacter sp. JZCK2]|uniref:thioredoxin domain-containing protein n=1 Tax=Salegentibacter tibetensis TaxID=2873600 RepID=UPI001CC9F33D|nr:thioredoxin domain-containing protein [Salegentibacter tibetensis]MBZ9730077.1 thioredoxin domain-containing protein [Salegentibacter tibetensis]
MKSSGICFLFLLVFFTFSGCNSEKKDNSNPDAAKNRLAQASSPYLIQHADNPVDWYEWGSEALQKAKKEDKPVIISVGYAACHWCHVMEEESFMDSSVAAIMNKDFVSIKIDREERPDIDKIYMNAAVLLNGSGGWPLNAIALPDGRPFFAGTYFPKEQWKNILVKVAEAYQNNKPGLVDTAEALTEGIRSGNDLDSLNINNTEFSEAEYVSIISGWQEQWDVYNGGYTGAQKFPLPVSWEALLQYYYLTGDEDALKIVNTSLQKMARGGIYDQLGGGFARYTTDPKWLIPHFEKMLYDNAQLISLYSKAYKVTGNEEYRQVVEESIEFVERELSNGNGAYFSSINADSDGEEGKYYVWSSKEIDKTLNTWEAKIFKKYYNVESYGNWEAGKNILYRNISLKEFSEENNIPSPDIIETLNSAKNKLLKQREARIKPTIDDKVLASWNALMLQSYIDAFTAFGDQEYLERALKTGNFLSREMSGKDQTLWRSYKDGEKKISGFLDDYAFVGSAYINLYQITFDMQWLEKAENLTNQTMKRFRDEQEVMFYYTATGQNDLIVRKTEIQDNIMPSSNSVMAKNLYVLGNLLENKQYLDLSDKMLRQISQVTINNPSSFANWTKLLGIKAFGAYEIAIVGEDAFQKNKEMNRKYLPTSIYMGGETENLPLLKAKLTKGETLIYVCQNKTCKYPVSEVSEALGLLESYKKEPESTGWWN